MAKINSTLLTARLKENEDIVSTGRHMESLKEEGHSMESLIEDAKKFLQIEENDLIVAEYSGIMKREYKKLETFRALVNLIDNGSDTNLLEDDEVSYLKNIEDRVAKQISDKYEIDVEELYEE